MAPRLDRDWTPRRRGAFYCSPACGGGCTLAQYRAVKAHAAALVARLGSGWTAHVWENLGWHYSARRDTLSVYPHPSDAGMEYSTLLGGDKGGGGGLALFCSHKPRRFRDPKKAVASQLQYARRVLRELQQLIDRAS